MEQPSLGPRFFIFLRALSRSRSNTRACSAAFLSSPSRWEATSLEINCHLVNLDIIMPEMNWTCTKICYKHIYTCTHMQHLAVSIGTPSQRSIPCQCFQDSLTDCISCRNCSASAVNSASADSDAWLALSTVIFWTNNMVHFGAFVELN